MAANRLRRRPFMLFRHFILLFLYSMSAVAVFACVAAAETDRNLSALPEVFIKKIQLTGNTVFSDADLEPITSPYEDKTVSSEALHQLCQELSRRYAEKGYVNSGAVLPDQTVENGHVVIQIIEGRLSDIEIIDLQGLRDHYIRSRLMLGQGPPLNVGDLQKQLKLMQQSPLIRRVDAELGPGTRLGESVLRIKAEEEQPWLLGLQYANDRSPSIGGRRAGIYAAHRNLTGWGDTLGGSYGFTEGLDDFSVYYFLPLTARETMLKLRYDKNDSAVIEEPFDEIDIESESYSCSITLSHPLFREPDHEMILSLSGERRHSETYVLDRRFSFSQGAQEGKSDVCAIRFSQDWLRRYPNHVFAVHSVFSLGIDAMGATVNETGADGKFFSWLGQFQWAGRFDRFFKTQVIFRTAFQATNEPLLSLEKFSVGGADSVRGYREDLMVRDRGIISSIECRIPVFRLPVPGLTKGPDEGTVQVAFPFFDIGWAENKNRAGAAYTTIASAGLGIRWDPTSNIHAHVYWGHALRDVEEAEDKSLQDHGFHFQINFRIF